MSGIFGGKKTSMPACIGVHIQPRLDTGEIAARRLKCTDGGPKLVWFGAVFCIVDHRVGAPRERQRYAECFRLGARLPRRNRYHRHRDTMLAAGNRRAGLLAISFY